MFTLNRVMLPTIGLGIGLVLAGCASPTDETSSDEGLTDQSSAAINEMRDRKDSRTR